MNTDISKTIVFTFTNKFTKEMIFRFGMPYLPFRAITGYYSGFYKRLKDVAADGFEKSLVTGSKTLSSEKTKRSFIEMASGIKLNFPYDVNEQDIKIITHHLVGIQMSCSK